MAAASAGTASGPAFMAHVERVLAPTLHNGDIVFMHNLRTHKLVGTGIKAYTPTECAGYFRHAGYTA